MSVVLVVVVASALAGQFTEGSRVSGEGCVSAAGGQVLVASSSVATFRDAAARRPKQGETFFLIVNVFAGEGVCDTKVIARPGFTLPAGMAFAPATAVGDPVPACFLGRAGALVRQACRTAPSSVRADGTVVFDPPGNGFWSIPSNQQLQVQIPVMSTAEQGSDNAIIIPPNIKGFVDYVTYDGSTHILRPTVPARVFFNPPAINYPAPPTTEIGPYAAHFFAFVDPHFNAGVLTIEVSKDADAFAAFEQVTLDDSTFENNIDLVAEGLDADAAYRWRATYRVTRNGTLITGASQSFRTAPPPRFAFSSSVTGSGSIASDPAVESDGTFIDRSDVTLTATPADGHRLVSFFVDGAAVDGAGVTLHIEAPVVATATFEPVPPPPPLPDGEGEGESTNVGEGEGESGEEPPVGEGEDESAEGEAEPPPADGEGEGEGASDGEGEAAVDDDDNDNDDDGGRGVDDDGDGDAPTGCSAGQGGGAFALVALVARRRRHAAASSTTR